VNRRWSRRIRFPNHNAYRVTLAPSWRPTGLEVQWTVGDRLLTALHRAEGDHWRVRIEYQGHVKEQEGDYRSSAMVEFVTHLFNAFILAGATSSSMASTSSGAPNWPPYMAVTHLNA
jgi:hypothetical protein